MEKEVFTYKDFIDPTRVLKLLNIAGGRNPYYIAFMLYNKEPIPKLINVDSINRSSFEDFIDSKYLEMLRISDVKEEFGSHYPFYHWGEYMIEGEELETLNKKSIFLGFLAQEVIA